MRTFKTKAFARFADRERLEDTALCEAVQRAATGLIDADLGGGVIKQRIARKGGGRSGGFRAIVLTAAAYFNYQWRLELEFAPHRFFYVDCGDGPVSTAEPTSRIFIQRLTGNPRPASGYRMRLS